MLNNACERIYNYHEINKDFVPRIPSETNLNPSPSKIERLDDDNLRFTLGFDNSFSKLPSIHPFKKSSPTKHVGEVLNFANDTKVHSHRQTHSVISESS